MDEKMVAASEVQAVLEKLIAKRDAAEGLIVACEVGNVLFARRRAQAKNR